MASVLAKTANKGAGASVSGNSSYFDKYIYQTKSILIQGHVINSSQDHPIFITGL